jgi:hypothetical protein
VGTGAKGQSHVVAKGADVRARIALYPEQDESPLDIEYLQFPDLAYPEHAFDSTLSRRALVQPSGELPGHLQDAFPVNIAVQPHQADIFLLMLEQERGEPYGITEHNEENTGYLRIERTGMPDLAAKHLSHPCSNLVAGRSFRLIQNNNPGPAPEVNWPVSVVIRRHGPRTSCSAR